jgi:hypothetical protein
VAVVEKQLVQQEVLVDQVEAEVQIRHLTIQQVQALRDKVILEATEQQMDLVSEQVVEVEVPVLPLLMPLNLHLLQVALVYLSLL